MNNVVLNAAEMKSFNRRKVLAHLRIQSVSRAELARKTGLTRSAISLIADGLLRDKILLEGPEQGGRVGRKSVDLVINPDAFYSIGLNISRHHYTIGLVNFGGTIRKIIRKPLDTDMDPLLSLSEICREIGWLLQTEALPGRLLGMGITAPGPVNARDGIILNPANLGQWRSVPAVAYFSARIPGSVILENKSNALALAEKTYCIKDEYESFLELVVDSGIGAGLIIDGELFRRGRGISNEFGHTCINMNGPRCTCGNYGCAELYASVPNLVAAVQKQDAKLDSWESITDLSAQGYRPAKAALEKEAEYLSGLIVNAVNILDIEAVVLTGVVSYNSAELIGAVSRKVNDRFMARGEKKIPIIPSRLPENPIILSSANLAVEHYIGTGK